VILINLLPHREAKRRQRKQAFFVGVGAAAVVGLAALGVWWLGLNLMLEEQQRRNQYLKSEIAHLDSQIKDIASLRSEIEALRSRQKAVENLQTDRNAPVRLLDELVRQTPEGVVISSVKQTGHKVELGGVAQTNERVSEMLRNLLYSSNWLEQPELIEIKSAMLPVTPGSKELRRLFQFMMRVQIKQPASAADAASGAAATRAAPARARTP
jgi:type IV pilus assembly protein PilN